MDKVQKGALSYSKGILQAESASNKEFSLELWDMKFDFSSGHRKFEKKPFLITQYKIFFGWYFRPVAQCLKRVVSEGLILSPPDT